MKKKKYNLELLAKKLLKEKGLQPDFSKSALQQLENINRPASPTANTQDLRKFLWCSIDNDDSRDLDQLTFGKKENDGSFIIWIAVADVDSLVKKDSAIDMHAQINTTSIYTPAKVFTMLPEKLSTDLTSLNENEDRVAMVVQIKVDSTGKIEEGAISPALVRNHAKLAYNAVGSWLEGRAEMPEKVENVSGLENALKVQHEVAQLIKERRHNFGALTLESPEVEAKLTEKQEVILALPESNYAQQLIENFMIAANYIMATHLLKAGIPSLRRVVRIPKRWDRIVEIAASFKEALPNEPNSKALEIFLCKRKKADPESFLDLSLTIIKLIGRGEYVVESPGNKPIGHFGLAVREYTHSTAPNRRFPDLISQRQYKALISGSKNPYPPKELQLLAEHCTMQEDAVMKVERHMSKSAAAMLLSSRIGSYYKGIITGAAEKGTWARIFDPPVEGKVVQGFEGLDIGERVTVKLASVDIPQGYINFIRE